MSDGSAALDSARRLRARLRARGPREVVNDYVGKFQRNVRSSDEIVFLTRAARWDKSVQRKTEEPLHVTRATREDSRDYERFIGTDSAGTFARRLTPETSCWLVRGRGMILHATWTTTGLAWTEELDRFFAPPSGSAYIYESFTRAEARGLGLYPLALIEIGNALASEGLDRLFVGVEVGNAASLRAISKAGFTPAFSVAFHRRLGKVKLDDATGPEAELAVSCLRAR